MEDTRLINIDLNELIKDSSIEEIDKIFYGKDTSINNTMLKEEPYEER
jgi:hypothetical protein